MFTKTHSSCNNIGFFEGPSGEKSPLGLIFTMPPIVGVIGVIGAQSATAYRGALNVILHSAFLSSLIKSFPFSALRFTFFYYLCFVAKYDDIFLIGSEAEFEREALRLFRYQAVYCKPYAEYVRLLGIEPAEVMRVEDIPMLPIELFKSHKLYCGDAEPQMVFTSSATTGMVQSKHYVADLALYERAFKEIGRAHV